MEWNEDDVTARIAEIENDRRVSLKVSGNLPDPDILITEAQLELSSSNENSEWLLEREGVISSSRGLLIKVAPKNISRALRVFNALIKAFRIRGFEFQRSNAILGKHNYEISIREKLVRVDNWKKEPTDILCLKVYSGYPTFEIYDTKNILIEERLAKVIAKVELRIEYLERTWAQNAKQQQAALAISEEKAKILLTKNDELTAFKALLKAAKRHHETKLIREYINFREKVEMKDDSLNEGLKNWIKWAHKKADWYDPITNSSDALLDEFDKESLD
ncbi:MAG: hypothetical protein JNJ75_08475 [Cyclobacteriaceae bacterium]|nr:hypothetical protein [Cyclobacteriaceae bacterium]